MKMDLKKVLIAVMLLFAAVLSFFPVADKMTTPETYGKITASIDEKTETVLKLTAASTLASAGISAIPGDTATPIAEKLADFTEYFLLILSVLYAEKYLLTVIGAAAFRVLLPLSCGLAMVGQFWKTKVLGRLAVKFAIFALILTVMVPMSIGVSDMIYDSYRNSLDQTITEAEDFSEDTAPLSEAGENKGLLASALERLSESVSGLSDRAAKLLNRFVQSLAILIVTSCVMPVLSLIFFLWIIKTLTGWELPASLPHRKRGVTAAAEEKK